MHAIVARQAGGPDVLELAEVERPVPGPRQLLVKVSATGVNFIDTYKRSGTYKVAYPFTPGSEAAGTVEEIGDGVTVFSPGDRVATAEGANCYAGYILVDEDKALPVPRGVDDFTAAALPLQGITAHYLINSSFRVEPGHTILLHAGAGGVGLLAIQLLKAKGARVVTTVSTDDKAKLAREAGADHVIPYEGFSAKVRELTDGTGADAVYDGVGKDTFDGSLECLAPFGMMVSFGNASGSVPPIDIAAKLKGTLYVTRPSLAPYSASRADLLKMASDLFDIVKSGKVKIDVNQRYPLKDAVLAHRDLESRKTTGSTVFVPKD